MIPVPVISEVVSMAPGRKKGTQKVLPVSMNNAAGSASRANNSSLLPALSTNNLSVKIAQNEASVLMTVDCELLVRFCNYLLQMRCVFGLL